MIEIKLNEFNDIKLKDREILIPILKKYPQCLCDYNFANMFCWAPIYKIKYCIKKNILFLYDERDDYLFMPLGNNITPDIFFQISDSLIKSGKSGNFFLIPIRYVEKYREFLEKRFIFKINPAYGDYIYSTKSLYELKGRKLHKKRNLISQFKRLYPNYKIKPLHAEMFEECLNLSKKWANHIKKSNDIWIKEEYIVLKRALTYFKELELEGLSLWIDKKLIGFSIWDELDDKTAVVHFEKSDLTYKGAAQIINNETAKFLLNRYEFINREQDMGISGLRQAKRSYLPIEIRMSYILINK